ncbi:MAG: hypothetical protein A2W03_09405 [Candidatus Aminicenantes bacterium RBG_16_63_16]|nr:MAG: hypothetical protein A2W03_09405 [Candidatus Aminicenantes bacterium RBG_16_63_16]
MRTENRRRTGRWYLPGLLYDGILERPLVGIRKKVHAFVTGAGPFPLLDICCGPGAQLGRLAAAGAGGEDSLFVGLDISFKMLSYAAARRPGVPFIRADAASLPFREGTIKTAILSFALHEKEPELRSRILGAARRVLAPGGRLVLVDFEKPWDAASRRAYVYTSLIERLGGARHFRLNRDFFRRGGLRALLAENGFVEARRHDIAAGTCAVVIAVPVPEQT